MEYKKLMKIGIPVILIEGRGLRPFEQQQV